MIFMMVIFFVICVTPALHTHLQRTCDRERKKMANHQKIKLSLMGFKLYRSICLCERRRKRKMAKRDWKSVHLTAYSFTRTFDHTMLICNHF